MKLIVSVAVGDSTVNVRCAYLEHDQLLDGNVRLVGCEELSTQGASGEEWATVVWSIPRKSIISYAAGEPAMQSAPVPAPELDPETQERARRKREEIREADRMMLEMARERIATREADPKASPATSAKRPVRGRKRKPATKPAKPEPQAD
jgi:hypothetical protein